MSGIRTKAAPVMGSPEKNCYQKSSIKVYYTTGPPKPLQQMHHEAVYGGKILVGEKSEKNCSATTIDKVPKTLHLHEVENQIIVVFVGNVRN
jgi:hypothetical protein